MERLGDTRTMVNLTPFAAALHSLVAAEPDAPAVTDSTGTISRRELDLVSNQWARAMAAQGVRQADIVSICLPSDRRFLFAAWAVWKLGATPQPLSSRLATNEMREIIELTNPSLVVGAPEAELAVGCWDATDADQLSDSPVPAVVSPSWKAPTSGGSTGRPKVILSTTQAVAEPLIDLASALRMRPGDTMLTPAPLHHNAPFLMSTLATLLGGHVVLMERFDAQRTVELIDRYSVGWLYAVPTMMSRIAKLPSNVLGPESLRTIHTMFHMAAPCADWLKRWWIDRLGPDAVWELYAGTEAQAITVIGGAEWLEHPGSVGRAILGDFKVLDETGSTPPPETVGEVFMRSPNGEATYRYLGATARLRDGWESLGDMGWMDADGYLYLSDRASDMVLVGGVNVYPAEVESALDAHPAVASSCVIGLPDDDLGNRLHAVVELSTPVDDQELLDFLAARLASHKRPRSIERSDQPLRDEAGKVRRSAVRAARLDIVPG